MGRAITLKEFKEGEVFCKWLDSKLIKNNKNVMGAELGPTGSGKSYRDLRKAELWYNYHFHDKVPEKNICFGIHDIMRLLAEGKLRKGEIIIFEEAGVNLGSLDFQQEVAKMMTYVMQSFRSMNIGIFFNLPYLSMLNKSARMLLHYSFESAGIDPDTKINMCKPKFHQVNQDTGKIYKKYPIINVNGTTRKIKRFSFAMPSQYLIDAYEKKKADYLKSLTQDFSKRLDEIEAKKNGVKIDYPTELEYECYHLWDKDGLTQAEIAKRVGKSAVSVFNYIKRVKEYQKLINLKKKSN
jgi:hypothetical protein